ncbi:MAG: TonB-dependent receptor [Prevotella sp.]|nr:TonB-dependent receptor [Prevotella sp.]
MEKRIKLLFACLFLCVGMAMAQTKVSGTVLSYEDNEPVVGAAVRVVGTNIGTVTDLNGKFSITCPQGKNTLNISYVGMEPIQVSARANMRILLKSDAQNLDEIVVVAYGTSTKGTFTGSAGVMKSDKLELRQVSDVSNALAGAVAGVQIQSSNGQPGTSAKVRVRGVGSINAGTSPLYVVDGVPFDGELSSINTADIESVTVLKDAASTALYGARGANGIIMITTKKAQAGKATVTLDAKWGSNSRMIKNYDVIRSPQEYLETEYAAMYNGATSTLGYNSAKAWQWVNKNITTNQNGGSGYQIYTVPEGEYLFGTNGKLNPNATLGYKDEANNRYYTPDNWEDEMFKPTLRQEYNATISGSTDRNNFYLSAGLLEDNGLVEGSGFKRLSTRLKDEYKVNDWMRVGTNIAYSYNKSFYPDDQTSSASSGNAFGVANRIAPIYPMYVRDAEGNIIYNQGRATYDYGTKADGTRDRSYMSISNPAGQLKYNKTQYIMDILSGNWYATITPLKGLTLKAQVALNVDNTNYNDLQNAYMGQFASLGGAASQSHSRTYGFDQQYIANYVTTIADKHHIDVTLGYDGYTYKYKYLGANGTSLYNPESFFVSNSVSQYGISGYEHNYATAGYFARANYSYEDKYIANVAVRRDGSSRFHKDNRWGTFWSGSVAWVISKENFMKDINWVDMLKFKASFGQQGNDAIGNYYAYLDQFSMTGDSSGFSDGTLSYKGNKDLTWETQTAFNVGVDFGLFKNKLTGSIEYFSRKSSDMLYYKPVAGSLGYTQIPMNIGSLTNSGLEIDLNYNILNTKDITWDFNVNATFIKNKINELHPDLKGKLIDGTTIYEEGYSMYRLYLPEWAGVDPENGDALWYYNVTDDNGNVTGRETTNNYTVASVSSNRIATDDMMPTVYGGFGTTLTAYGFDLSVQASYQLGGQIYDSGYASLMHGGNNSDAGRNWHKDIHNAWTTPGQITDVPRLNSLSNNGKYVNYTSTRFLTSSDYLSLNNVTVGYTLPKSIVNKLGLTKLRVYFSGDNLALLSARKGLDPRQSYTSASVAIYTAIRSLSGGVSVAF